MGFRRMDQFSLQTFHEVCRQIDFRTPLVGLLGEFQRGAIADVDRLQETLAVETHLGVLAEAWDSVLPGFPACPWKRRTLTWEYHRGARDAYLKQLIADIVPANVGPRRLIVNPAAVFGRHARALAKSLPEFDVIGSDIEPKWNRLYQFVNFWRYHNLTNYQFVQEDIFNPDARRLPATIAFWGACGSVTDGCIDCAIATNTPFLICRSCCHDNIGGNTHVVRRPGALNRFFVLKNRLLLKEQLQQTGAYFCNRYGKSAYPRSQAARDLVSSDTLIAVAQNSVDSDICRSLIDLDRCLYLQEHGYDVVYREELFFAHKRDLNGGCRHTTGPRRPCCE